MAEQEASTNPSQPQQAGAIPFRRSGEDVFVCLLRRRGSDQWSLPKGLIDPGDSPEETALNETWEEAGLKGNLVGETIGSYEYEKWGSTFTVAVYLLEVQEEFDSWLEEGCRERRWMSLAEAFSLLAAHPVRVILEVARARLLGGPTGA